ncbi:MAG TPA: MarC family protein [archaeon]|nr:MarC family protein [archaeon]
MEITLLVFFQAALSLFAIVDPIGGLPVFISLTQGLSEQERRRIFRFAVAIAFLLVLSFALVGSFILHHLFHIEISEFAFAGGMLLVVVGIREMLVTGLPAESPEEKNGEKDRKQHYQAVAVSPIACPLLAGPGTIVTVILFQQHYGQLFAISVCVVVFSFTMLILSFASRLSRLMGPIGMLAVSRILQIFIIAIGVHFMFMGLTEAFPRLFGGGF